MINPARAYRPTPPAKGRCPLFEILGRDFSTIWLAGILAMLGGLPFAAGVWFAVETHSLVPLVIAGVLGGMIAAPQIVGLNDTILRTLRDEPGYWWETYRRTWKRNLKESLLPGAVCGLLLAMELFSLCHINIAGGHVAVIAVLLAIILLAGIAQYLYVQVALLDLSFAGLLKTPSCCSWATCPAAAWACCGSCCTGALWRCSGRFPALC